jgi:hypothetical protein
VEGSGISPPVGQPNPQINYGATNSPADPVWSHRTYPTLIISSATPNASDEASDVTFSSKPSFSHRRVHSAEPISAGDEVGQVFNSIGGQFPGEDFSDRDPIAALQSKFFDCRIEWPKEGNQYFIPADDLRELVTVDSILNQLKFSKPDMPGDRLLEMAQSACESAYKLFAILVCANKGGTFYDFLQEGLSDADLPFTRSSDSKPSHNLYSSRPPHKPIQSIRSWGRYQVSNFSRDQWQMLSPIFKQSNQVEHYELLDNQVLPFVEDEERDLAKSDTHGGFGSVWRVVMHPAHQFLHLNTNPGVCK